MGKTLEQEIAELAAGNVDVMRDLQQIYSGPVLDGIRAGKTFANPDNIFPRPTNLPGRPLTRSGRLAPGMPSTK